MGKSLGFWFATMGTVAVILAMAVAIGLVVGLNGQDRAGRSFTIDYNANTFLMDGKSFRYISGSFHYFRALPDSWRSRLKSMRAAGLNAVDTYVEWALHNPKDGQYTFDGIADVEKFIKIAQEEDLYVILRPGPYICAERDNGGLPYWLFRKYPSIKLRTNDPDYKREVSIWYSKLMPRVQKYFYGNGGPIIMVQVENEYGAFHACDKSYLNWLRDETEIYVQGNAVLFTTDIPDERMQCGKIDGVFATTDFGFERINEIDAIFERLRTVQPNGPLVNSEFYPGWLTHWQEENQRRDGDQVAASLRKLLASGASVNIYMFFGGSNFGFTAGANDWGFGNYTPDITSYDYDAVMDEAGDPTVKYVKVRNVISEFVTMPDLPVPTKTPKMAYEPVTFAPIMKLLSGDGRKIFGVKTETGKLPKSFEELDQFSGLVLYEAELPKIKIDPTLLTVNDLHDRALVYIDELFVGILSRENAIKSLPISAKFGRKLQILVENQGRINFNVANDTKGILGSVTLQKLDGQQEEILNWTSTSIPLESQQFEALISNHINNRVTVDPRGLLLDGPVIFHGQFSAQTIGDSYLDLAEWGKGVLFVNNFNLGRYWPLVGPQITTYIPKEIVRKGVNEIVLIEYEKVPNDYRVRFTTTPKLDNEN